jgi:hypothetical protein
MRRPLLATRCLRQRGSSAVCRTARPATVDPGNDGHVTSVVACAGRGRGSCRSPKRVLTARIDGLSYSLTTTETHHPPELVAQKDVPDSESTGCVATPWCCDDGHFGVGSSGGRAGKPNPCQ